MTINCNMYGVDVKLNKETGAVSGKTFSLKDNLKKHWSCTWDTDIKTWILPEKNIVSFIEKFAVAAPDNKIEPAVTNKASLCPKCGTYCYGDCKAN